MSVVIFLKNNQLGLRNAIKKTKSLGVEKVQLFAGYDYALDITQKEIKSLKNIIADNGITVTSACTDMGSLMFYEKDCTLLDTEKRAINVVKELGANIFTLRLGVIPEERDCVQYESLYMMGKALAEYCDSIGGCLAIRTGSESSTVMKSFLRDVNCKGMKVCLEPAELVMSATDTPQNAVKNLKDYIVLANATDGIQLKAFNPKAYYAPRYYAKTFCGNDVMKNVQLGKGKVDFDAYFSALSEIGYAGDIVVECDENTLNIEKTLDFLRERWI